MNHSLLSLYRKTNWHGLQCCYVHHLRCRTACVDLDCLHCQQIRPHQIFMKTGKVFPPLQRILSCPAPQRHRHKIELQHMHNKILCMKLMMTKEYRVLVRMFHFILLVVNDTTRHKFMLLNPHLTSDILLFHHIGDLNHHQVT